MVGRRLKLGGINGDNVVMSSYTGNYEWHIEVEKRMENEHGITIQYLNYTTPAGSSVAGILHRVTQFFWASKRIPLLDKLPVRREKRIIRKDLTRQQHVVDDAVSVGPLSEPGRGPETVLTAVG